MLTHDDVKELLKLKYFQGLTQKQIALELDVHENTISRYCTYFKKNLSDNAKSLINQYISHYDDAEHLINQYYPTYVQPVVQSILLLSDEIHSTSPTVLYRYVQDYPEKYPNLLGISMSSIRRGLKMI